jgi:hypothetical protein
MAIPSPYLATVILPVQARTWVLAVVKCHVAAEVAIE